MAHAADPAACAAMSPQACWPDSPIPVTEPQTPLGVEDASDEAAEWAEISVEDVFAEALQLSWPGINGAASYTVQAKLASQPAGSPAHPGWTRTDLTKPEAFLHQLPEACDLQVRVAAYAASASASKPRIGQWTQVRTFELDLGVEKLNVDPEGNERGSCAESHCKGYVSTEAQDPCTEAESMALCARCGVHFARHLLQSSGATGCDSPAAVAPVTLSSSTNCCDSPATVAPVALSSKANGCDSPAAAAPETLSSSTNDCESPAVVTPVVLSGIANGCDSPVAVVPETLSSSTNGVDPPTAVAPATLPEQPPPTPPVAGALPTSTSSSSPYTSLPVDDGMLADVPVPVPESLTPLGVEEASDEVAEWAEISVEDVFAEALQLSWPGIDGAASYTVQAKLASQPAGSPAHPGWTRTGLTTSEAFIHQLPEACDLQVRVAAYTTTASASKPRIGQWTQVRTFELHLDVDKLNVDPEGNQRGPCAESHCKGYISTEAQDPSTETETMALCARCGVDFGRHLLQSNSANSSSTPAAEAPPALPKQPPPTPIAGACPASTQPQTPPEPPVQLRPAPAFRYCIVGSWNDWKGEKEMFWNAVGEHYEFGVELSEEAQESFQILLEGRYDKCVHPNRPDANPHIDYKLCGPDSKGHELNWTIGKSSRDRASPGDRFKIRFFIHSDGRPQRVDWQPLTQDDEKRLQAQVLEKPSSRQKETLLEKKLRWGSLTKDLHQFYRVSEHPAVPVPGGKRLRDKPPEALLQLLTPFRERVIRTVQEKLAKYDNGTSFPRPEDAMHGQREGYELDLLGMGLKELRDAIHKHYNHGSLDQVWKVVGGENKGGLKVRIGTELKSEEKDHLLATGALVEEVETVKDRMSYRLLAGDGPKDGWISTKIKSKATVVKVKPGELAEVPQAERDAQEAAGELQGKKLEEMKQRPENPIVIIGLMAAHISTKARLDRFRHVLRSVQRQEILVPDTEFLFSLSWSSTEEFEDEVMSAVSSVAGPRMVAAHQMGRHTQFQHLRAALAKAEDSLSERWAAGDAPKGEPSIWVLFGDDDDIWHRRRVNEYAQAMRSHHILDAVGLFVTTARAVCKFGKQIRDVDLPVDEASIETFLQTGRGKRMDKQPDTLEWRRICKSHGFKACTLQLPDELTLEYFDFCPRLRIMREFLDGTSQELLSHRYCDLRFNEFLRLYPFKGSEMGFEASFFFPDCWMLFYATPIMEDDHVKKIIEKADDSAADVSINNGHMSANYAVDGADEELSRRTLADFNHFDTSVSQSRLARYWAAFRNSVENYIIRHAGEKLDQRMFDLIIYISMQSSFFKFVEKLDTLPDVPAIAGVKMMEYLGQGYAKVVAQHFCISVLWHRPNLFMEPPPAPGEEEAVAPAALPGYFPAGVGKPLAPMTSAGYPGIPGGGYSPGYKQTPHFGGLPAWAGGPHGGRGGYR